MLMWTRTQLPSKAQEFLPNHFVVLAQRRGDTPKVVDLTEWRPSSPSYADIVRSVKASPTIILAIPCVRQSQLLQPGILLLSFATYSLRHLRGQKNVTTRSNPNVHPWNTIV